MTLRFTRNFLLLATACILVAFTAFGASNGAANNAAVVNCNTGPLANFANADTVGALNPVNFEAASPALALVFTASAEVLYSAPLGVTFAFSKNANAANKTNLPANPPPARHVEAFARNGSLYGA